MKNHDDEERFSNDLMKYNRCKTMSGVIKDYIGQISFQHYCNI